MPDDSSPLEFTPYAVGSSGPVVTQDVNLVGIKGVAPDTDTGTSSAGTLRVVEADTAGTATVTGSILVPTGAVGFNALHNNNLNALLVSITGTWTGTLQFEINLGAGFQAVAAVNLITGAASGTTTVDGMFKAIAAQQFRVVSLADFVGQADIVIYTTQNLIGNWVGVLGPVTVAGSVAIDGTPTVTDAALAQLPNIYTMLERIYRLLQLATGIDVE